MEYVAVLAGEPFSDAPACTHPVLATIARLVNDAAGDTDRPRLAVLAPDLAGAGTGDTDLDLLADASLVAAAVYAAAGHTAGHSLVGHTAGHTAAWQDGHPRLVRLAGRAYRRHLRLARRRPAGDPLTRWWRRLI
ncbi:MAG: hypothetical protein ACRDUA_06355, partial [Micromonosporaceae bacterium]